jgi:hypothetical protein
MRLVEPAAAIDPLSTRVATRAVAGAVARLMAASALAPSEIAERLGLAFNPDYWRSLTADVGIEHSDLAATSRRRAAIPLPSVAQHVATEGFFHLDRIHPSSLMKRMFRAVTTVRSHGWHPAFAFVYDEFWRVSYSPRVIDVVTTVLGPGARLLPKTWCHYVASVAGAAGWPPHVDDSSKRRKITVWTALTDATLDNGCMYVVPKNRTPRDLTLHWESWRMLSMEDVQILLQNATPLPARAGSVLGWTSDVVHWGGVVRRTRTPRVSLSFEFVSADDMPAARERPLLPANRLPAFEERLQFIARNVIDYSWFEPSATRYRELAVRMMD